jgi:cysteine synthase|tara:strand:- start:12 stop:332 length:321 start_codon:yes stop_codon:yes gene_type:complete
MNAQTSALVQNISAIERQKLIKHYGAQLVTTAKELGTKGAIDKARSMVIENPNAVMLDQFANQANPDTHFNSTAAEIWRDNSDAGRYGLSRAQVKHMLNFSLSAGA